jgi:hypothetical protein
VGYDWPSNNDDKASRRVASREANRIEILLFGEQTAWDGPKCEGLPFKPPEWALPFFKATGATMHVLPHAWFSEPDHRWKK